MCVCPVCHYKGEKIEIREDLNDNNRMVKFISCAHCGVLKEKQNWKKEGY